MSRRPDELAQDASQELWPQSDNRTNVLFRGRFVYINQQRIESPTSSCLSLQDYAKHLVAENASISRRREAAGRISPRRHAGTEEPGQAAFARMGGKALVIIPRDAADWLKPNQCFLVSDAVRAA